MISEERGSRWRSLSVPGNCSIARKSKKESFPGGAAAWGKKTRMRKGGSTGKRRKLGFGLGKGGSRDKGG